MLSWQRICALARRSAGPLFFVDEQDPDEPLVVLPLRIYESLLAQKTSDSPSPSIRKIPVRIEEDERAPQGISLEKGLAPDLLGKKETLPDVPKAPSSEPVEGLCSEPLIQTPPPILDQRGLEERFYFQPPSSHEYG